MSSTYCLKCSQPYLDPRMLSCCHSFCAQCVHSLVTEGAGINSLTCPFCHQTTPVPHSGVTSLPRSLYFVNRQSDTLSKITSNLPSLCDSCSEDISVAYCTECRDLLCQQCWDAHQRVRSSHTHSSFTLQEACTMSRDNLTKLIPSFPHTCQDHTDQQLKYYCQQCIIPVCIECTVINHKGHPITDVSKQVDSSKATIYKNIQVFLEAQTQLQKFLISGEEIIEKIKTRKIEIDTIICQTFATFQQLLHERKEALLAKNNDVANAKEAHLCFQLEGIRYLLETMTYYQSFVTSAVGEYNDVELLSVAHTLQTRAKKLQQEFTQTSLKVCESPTISIDINTDELATKIENVDITFNEISPNHTTAEVPAYVHTSEELKITVISKSEKGKKLSKGGTIVSGKLVPAKEKGTLIEANATDCGDGTYLVSLTPQQLGQHELSLTIEGRSIQRSPFNLLIFRDYTTLKNPVQTITGISYPCFMALSNNGDMFVTSSHDHCVYVYDSSGRLKTTIGSFGTGPLQFDCPLGIAINGDVMYVAEKAGSRIHKLTLGGEFLGMFGIKGSSKGEFRNPWDICVGPDGRIYVAELHNNRIQVFHSDDSCSHIINCHVSTNVQYPTGLSFDCSGFLHVTDAMLKTVCVFTAEGEYIRQYDQSFLNDPHGIAIDSAGYSLVVNKSRNSLLIFDPHGNYIHSIGGFNNPMGVAVASNGSVWVTDRGNNRLVKF